MRVIFMGTPQFAVPSLQALLDQPEQYEVVGVVTQPDAVAGRGNVPALSEVKKLALNRSLQIFQPESLKSPDAVAPLAALKPDLIVVAAFGQILRKPVLEMPVHGCLNVHASLLPRWRGASPISAAILAGDTETGVTIMKMAIGLDSGPVISQVRESILPTDTTGHLTKRLAFVGARALVDAIPGYVNGTLTPEAQSIIGLTTCKTLKKEEGRLDWFQNATVLERHVRAMLPWPGGYTTWRGKLLKVISASVASSQSIASGGQIGKVVRLGRSIGIGCGEGVLELVTVQPEGRKPMPAADFARGAMDFVGSVLIPSI